MSNFTVAWVVPGAEHRRMGPITGPAQENKPVVTDVATVMTGPEFEFTGGDMVEEPKGIRPDLAKYKVWALPLAQNPYGTSPTQAQTHSPQFYQLMSGLSRWLDCAAVRVDEFVSGHRRVLTVRTLVPTMERERQRMLADLPLSLATHLEPLSDLAATHRDLLKGKPL